MSHIFIFLLCNEYIRCLFLATLVCFCSHKNTKELLECCNCLHVKQSLPPFYYDQQSFSLKCRPTTLMLQSTLILQPISSASVDLTRELILPKHSITCVQDHLCVNSIWTVTVLFGSNWNPSSLTVGLWLVGGFPHFFLFYAQDTIVSFCWVTLQNGF